MCCNRRTGILVLGTLKLLLVNLLGLGLCGVQLSSTKLVYMHLDPLIQLYVTTVLMLFGAISSIVLLSGSYKRHRTSLLVYFWYSAVYFILSLLRVANTIILYSKTIRSMYTDYEGWRLVLYSPDFYIIILLFGLFDLALQLCIIILVRQEINKLGSRKTSVGAELRPTCHPEA